MVFFDTTSMIAIAAFVGVAVPGLHSAITAVAGTVTIGYEIDRRVGSGKKMDKMDKSDTGSPGRSRENGRRARRG
jgi:branched-subunit amino acid ABC-type transport system permease component